MNRIFPAKLKLSKWTARHPQNREKHFLVTDVEVDDAGNLLRVELQAVYSGRAQWLDWRALRDSEAWLIGWQ